MSGVGMLVAGVLFQAARVLCDLGHEVRLTAALFCYEGGGTACGTR